MYTHFICIFHFHCLFWSPLHPNPPPSTSHIMSSWPWDIKQANKSFEFWPGIPYDRRQVLENLFCILHVCACIVHKLYAWVVMNTRLFFFVFFLPPSYKQSLMWEQCIGSPYKANSKVSLPCVVSTTQLRLWLLVAIPQRTDLLQFILFLTHV